MEKACGCIIFNNDKVLIIKQLNGVVGFPKGHVEGNETEVETARREVLEEVGIEVEIDPSTRYIIYYPVNGVMKEVIYFKATGSGKIKIQESELESASWVDKDKVLDMLSHDNLKKIWLEALCRN